jgi:2,4-dienoyl-CoA reductase-like NADH-dependent reductase (Old Yellow Enzyme family)/thioredoxin reductase
MTPIAWEALMDALFKTYDLGRIRLMNRFVFPPIKLGSGNPDGTVTDRQLRFYRRIAEKGPAVMILEPVSVTPDGKEHPKQLCIHFQKSAGEIKKIVDVIHNEDRLACLHLNHAGAGANPMATKTRPKAPSVLTCPASGQESEALTEDEIEAILEGYKSAVQKALEAGIDLIEIQGGHGYLISQFLNSKTNLRTDSYGLDRLLFPRRVFEAVKSGAPDLPFILRISGNEMSPEYGISREDLLPLVKLAEGAGIAALHVGMGSACFSPPWYFHHASLPEKPQEEALEWIRGQTNLPLIAAGRMGRKERIEKVLTGGLADLIAIGRPLIADPDLIEKWRSSGDEEAASCGYCLQGCLHRVKNGQPIGCNLNPEIGQPPLKPADYPKKILITGGGPAGMSAALYLTRRGHTVTLLEKEGQLGGQFALAWKARGKEKMKDGLNRLAFSLESSGATVMKGTALSPEQIRDFQPDLLVWAAGARQNIPEIPGLDKQHRLTSIEYFSGEKTVKGPRVLVIGAGRTGLEIAEKLGKDEYEVVATKRTDPVGSMMEMITKNLTLKRIGEMEQVLIMPHTTVKAFWEDRVDIEQDGTGMSLEPFDTVILASGMIPAAGPDNEIRSLVPEIRVIGDAAEVRDIFSAVQAGFELAGQI